jgi:hypothetical protein
MMNFGSKNVKGGFFGTKMLTGFFVHGPEGELLDSGSFLAYPDIDPPESTTTPDPGGGLPSAPTSVLITVVDTPLILPSKPTNLSITVEDS